MLGGDCYPATPIGINLPNADWIRKEYGSKSVTIDNITYAYEMAAHGNGFDEEFVLRAEDRARMEAYGKLADDLHTDLHGVWATARASWLRASRAASWAVTARRSRRRAPTCSVSTIWATRSWSSWDSCPRSTPRRRAMPSSSSTV